MSTVPPFTYTLTNGQIADATQVMSDLNLVRDYLNTAFDNQLLYLPLTGGSISGALTLNGALVANAAATFNSNVTITGAGASSPKVFGTNSAWQLLNAASTQNYYMGIADADANNLYIGRGHSAAQGIAPSVKISNADLWTFLKAPFVGTAPIFEATRGASAIYNGLFTADIAANALTLRLKTMNGVDPSATDPVYVWFENTNPAAAAPQPIAITNAVGLVIPSTATMGTIANQLARLRIMLINAAGTVEMAVMNTYVAAGPNIAALSESDLITTTAMSTAAVAGIPYSSNARAGVPFRWLGYIEITEAVAGTWNAGPAKLHTQQPEELLPGARVQIARSTTGTVATGTTTVPLDNTIPQNTEGDQYMSQAIVPTSAANLLHVHHSGNYSQSGASDLSMVSLFFDAIASAFMTVTGNQNAGGASYHSPAVLDYWTRAGALVTAKIRAGGTAGTLTLNGTGGTQTFGGVYLSDLYIEEIMV